jgi:hypothetical protein
MKEVVKCVILSHKRATSLVTHKTISNCVVCVPESQESEYLEHNRDCEIVTHPDSVVGLSAKIKWVYEKYRNVCMLDDDLDAILRTYIDGSFGMKSKLTPDEAYEMIQVSAIMAKDIGAYLFGYATSGKPVAYDSTQPFKLSGFVIGGCVGFLDGFKMVLPKECVGATDYFISAINAFHHRKCFIDTRFYASSKAGTFVSNGGSNDYRNMETEKSDYLLLRKYFGDAIQRKTGTAIRKSLQSNFEKSLIVGI